MRRPEIFNAYEKLPQHAEQSGDKPSKLELHTFIENYAASLSSLIRAFPKDNVDMNALEAHLWDRLKYFYKYDKFGQVSIEAKEEQKFINEAIKLIEAWFYQGDWTSCLEVPSDEQMQEMFAGREKGFLSRTRSNPNADQHPNLGRNEGLPNIYDEVASGRPLREIYEDHAFKFFHGPAGVINTLTKIRTRRGIFAHESKFKKLVGASSAHAAQTFEGWGYDIDASGDPDVATFLAAEERMRITPRYIKAGEEYQRPLFFYKTSMVAAELIRRTGEGRLTQEGFQDIMRRRRDVVADFVKKGESGEFVPFDFVPNRNRSSSVDASSVHVNTTELPFALFAVDHLKAQYDQRKK